MKIYTKTGDEGKTSLLGGTKVSKHDLRIEAYGTVDELNAHIGMIRSLALSNDFQEILHFIQDRLFVIGSILANDPSSSHYTPPSLSVGDILELETSIDQQENSLSPLKNFILPGDSHANAIAHICRSVCRRAERRIVALHQEEPVDKHILQFINRLSDWLFILARTFTKLNGSTEIIWKNS